MKSKFFTKFLQKPRFRIQCSDLPADIAIGILEKENELEKTVNLALVQDLTALYTKAIEHYESQANPKYLDFQEKLQKMLLRPQVFSILTPNPNKPTKKSVTNTETPKSILKSPQISQKTFSPEHQKQLSFQLSCALDPHLSTNLLKSHSNLSKSSSTNAISVLKSQDLSLTTKLLARKLKNHHKKGSLSNIPDLSCIEEESLLTTKSSLNVSQDFREGFDRFEQRLEQIMEKNLTERAWKVLEIREKYLKEIEEVPKGKEMEILVKQIRNNMQTEIKAVIEKYDQQRKEEIQVIKKEVYS